MRWLEPAEQARLRGLGLVPRRPAGTQAPGRHRTAARGFSRDFAQHRPYAEGDELRSIDWKAYARLDRYYVREYRAEDRVSLQLLLDASPSMRYSSGGRSSKLDIARRAAAGLAWVALAQGDEAGLAGCGGRVPAVQARAGAAQLAAIDEALSGAEASPGEDLPAALDAAAARLPRRSALVVISDLLGDTARVLKALRRLTAGRRELLVLRVLDPDERDFPYEGAAVFEGLEGGELALDAGEAAEAYRAAFARQDEAYRSALRRAEVRAAVVYTDGAWTAGVSRLLGP